MSSYLTFGSFTKEETEKMGLPLIPLGPRVIYHNIPKSSKVITFGSLTLQETVSMGFSLLEIRYPALLCERCKRTGHSINDCYSDTTYDGTPINDFVYKIHRHKKHNPRNEKPKTYRSLWLDAELKNIYAITNHIMQEHMTQVSGTNSPPQFAYTPSTPPTHSQMGSYVYPLPLPLPY
jgi:hypothetical protein